MKIPYFPFSGAFCLAGLLAALALGGIGSCSLRAIPVPLAEIERMDAKAQPHFEGAQRNIPLVVEQLTGTTALFKLCGLMARDKLNGTRETQDYLSSVLEKPIIEPCREGASVYGCDFKTAGFLDNLKSINADYTEIEGYALGGLAIEAIFLKKTLASLGSVLGSAVTRLTAVYGGGTAFAAADGPLPVGELLGVVLAAGGTAWSGYDLYEARKQLPAELTAMLKQAINDCQAACRMEAIK